jgi:hypothetical protein
MRISFKLVLLAFAVTTATSLLHADSLKEIAAALDIDASYFTAQGYIKYKYDKYGDLEYDANDKPVIAKQNTDSYWTVQSKTTNDTSPYYGKSCIRSTLGSRTPSASTDGTCARLYLQFFGPGTFSFAYKTATDSDTLNVYIDGEDSMEATGLSGYGVDQEWETVDVAIPGGPAPDGTYTHVVIVEFLKSGPSYWDGKYDKVEGPDKPNKDDFDMKDPFDKETYEELLAEYESFYNCIWLDRFQWTPDTPTLTFQSGIDFAHTTILDRYDVSFMTNVLDFGYFITYTTNGSAPTAQSQRYFTYDSEGDLVENTINVDKNMTIRAKVFTSTGAAYTPEIAISAAITVKASNPEFTAVKQPDNSLKVTMQTLYLVPKVFIDINGNPCIDEESGELVDKNQIYYTLDGSDPTTKGKLYDPELGVTINGACVIKAVAKREGVENSDIVEFEVGQTAAPTVNVFNSQGQIEPYNVYSNSRGMTVKATAPEGAFLQVSFDGGKTYVEFNGTFYLKAENGQTSATALVRAVSGDLLPSKPVSVTATAATESWAFGAGVSGEQSIAISPGWNLISFPSYLTLSSINDIIQSQTVFAYDPNTKFFVQPSTIQPGVAYWIYVKSSGGVSVLRGAPASVSIPPCQNWEFYAPSESKAVPANIIAWEYQNGKFREAASFVAGRGYIIHNR